MLSTLSQDSSNPLLIIVLFSLFGFIINRILYKRGFFELPLSKDSRKWSGLQTVSCICIYLTNSFFFTPLVFNSALHLATLFNCPDCQDQKFKMILLQSIDILLNIIGFSIFLFFQHKERVKALWKDPLLKETSSYLYDILLGFFTWFIAFPLIISVNLLAEFLNQLIFKSPETDQVAVQFLKLSSSSIITLVISMLMIIISAPFIEEFLFRGCIQNFLRKHLGTKTAIIITSLLFSFMHYSASQKTSNIPLIASLFSFSIYLGFVYEKTRSLISSIILHMTFNAISVVRILFF